MKIDIERIINNIDFKGRFKSNGTGRGLILIAGIILFWLIYPERAKEYMELVLIALLYGGSNVFRKEKKGVQTIQFNPGLPKEVIERLINVTTLDTPMGIDWFLDPITKKKYQLDKRMGKYAELSDKAT